MIPAFVAELKQRLTSLKSPGVAFSIHWGTETRDDELGYQDWERTQPLKPAPMYIYSIQKPLLALWALQTVALEELDLPVATLMPHWPLHPQITLRHLLNHTSGLPDYGGTPAYHKAVHHHPLEPWGDADYMSYLDKELLFEPGQGWAYSNIGYYLIKKLLEHRESKTLSQWLHELSQSLGLKQTFGVELPNSSNVSPGWSRQMSPQRIFENMVPKYHPDWVSPGLIASTPGEINTIMTALFTGRLLAEEQLKAMQTLVLVPERYPPHIQPAYGLGLMIDEQAKFGQWFGHGGAGPGYSTFTGFWPNFKGRELCLTLFLNSDQEDALTLVWQVLSAVEAA